MSEELRTAIERIKELKRQLAVTVDIKNAYGRGIDELVAANKKLQSELDWYQVEAVARTNTDGRTSP